MNAGEGLDGEWIGMRWCGYAPGASPAHRRLTRKANLLLARSDRYRQSFARVRLYIACGNAAAIVFARIAELEQHEGRLAA